MNPVTFARTWLRPGPEVLGINRRNLDLVFSGYRPGRFAALDDKLETKERLAAAGIPTTRTVAAVRRNADLARIPEILSGLDEVVIKPAAGAGGRGILVLERRGETWVSPGGACYSEPDLAAHVADILAGGCSLDESEDVAIFEERVHPHAFLTDLYPHGLGDLRVVLEHGEPVQAMWRIPTSASDGKANLHSGGIGLGVDLATGRTTAAVRRGRRLDRHPDSGAPLIDLPAPQWEACIELARRASRVVDVDYLGVDIAVDADRGPLILEINARPGLAIQVANGKPQPVTTRAPSTRFDRFTFSCAWILLAVLAASPRLAQVWQQRQHRRPPATVLSHLDRIGAAPDPRAAGGVEWDEEEKPIGPLSTVFQQARDAAAGGDTARSLRLYAAATQDSSIAPFALNNIALLHRRRQETAPARAALEEAIARYPTYHRGHYNLGLILLDDGRQMEAMRAFQEVVRLRPSHAGSWAKIGDLHQARGELDAAVTAYEKAIRYDPASRAYRLRLGMTHRARQDHDAAAARFIEVVQLRPDHEEAAYWWARSVLDGRGARLSETGAIAPDSILAVLSPHAGGKRPSRRCLVLTARLHWEQGHVAEAYRQFDRLRRSGLRPAFHGKAAAIAALELGLWQEAATRLAAVRADDEDFVRRQLDLCALGRRLDESWQADLPPDRLSDPALAADGISVSELAQRARTRPDLDRRLSDPGARPASLLLWLVHRWALARDDAERSAAALDTLMAVVPDFVPLLHHRFEQALADGDEATARAVGKRIRSLQPRNPEVPLRLAAVALERGDVRAAWRLLEGLSKRDRLRTEFRLLSARILLAENKASRAVRLLKQAVQADPRSADAWADLGRAYLADRKPHKAIEALAAALDLDPGRVDVRRAFARQLMRKRRYEEATEEWRRVVRLDEENASDLFNLALCLQRDGHQQDAVGVYERVLELDPAKHQAWFNRSLALEKLGRLALAREGYERVLSMEPDHAASLAKLAALQVKGS